MGSTENEIDFECEILPELQNCLPEHTSEQIKELDESLRTNGMMHGIQTCTIKGRSGRFVLDGHTRYRRAKELGVVRWEDEGAIVRSRRAGKKSGEFSFRRYHGRMITIRDYRTGDLFDPWDYLGANRKRLLATSWARVFRNHLLDHLPVSELIESFSREHGRPTKDFHLVIGALILQQLHDLTDAATVEAVAFNITWHYALDIRAESDAYLCERTLRNYRRLLVEKGLDQVLFRSLTDRLIKAAGTETGKQRLDSTAIRSAMRGLTRLGIIVESIGKFLRELRRRNSALHDQVDSELIRKYVDREGSGCFASTKPSESKRRLPEAAADLLVLVTQFRLSAAAELESYRILARVLSEQCEVVSDPASAPRVRLKEPEEMTCDNILNPADPDATYNKHRGVGYMVQVMETYREDAVDSAAEGPPYPPDLITHVAVGPMNVHDGSALGPALADAEAREIRPEVVLADSHYGSNENLAEAKRQGVELVSPSMPPKGSKQEKLTLESFELDEQGRVVRCPQGHFPVMTSIAKDKLQVVFDEATCGACAFRNLCCASAVGRKTPRHHYTHDRVRQRTRRLGDHTEAFRARYRWRSGIEGTMSRLKFQMRMASLRIRGRAAVRYVSFLRALGLNIRRVAGYEAAIG